LDRLKAAWLNALNRDYDGRRPSHIIESERRRVNLNMSATEYVIDEDCEVCETLAVEFDTPMFWHVDGCNMDEGFEFSFCKTRDEFEAKQREWEKFNEEFESDLKAGKYNESPDESLIDFDDDASF